MPEGDTLFQLARKLRPQLVGSRIVQAHSNRPGIDTDSLVGQEVCDVESRGKHLLLTLADQRVIHSHLGMKGAWHLYRRDQRWSKPNRASELVLATNRQQTLVCFAPKTLEILSRRALLRHRWLTQLGPDILAPEFDSRDALVRCRALPNATAIGALVMQQDVVCGIGNVYKSEVLFLQEVNPFVSAAGLTDEQIMGVFQRARYLMLRNLEGRPRRTRFAIDGPSKWVYRRHNEPCLKCGCAVQMKRQGKLARSTYYCPSCQGVPTPPAASIRSASSTP